MESAKGPGGAWQRTGLWDFVQTRSISEQAVSLYVTLSCISVSKFNTCCIYSHPQKCPSGGHLRFPRNFLALKIVGKAQECDLSVTGHPTVDKPFRWLISCSVLGCFEAPPICILTLLAILSPAHADAFQQTHTCMDFASWILQEGFLARCSHQTVSFSHLNKISPLGDTAISSFHPSLNSQVTRGCETAHFTKARWAQEQHLTPDTVTRCGSVLSAVHLEPNASSSHQGAQLPQGAGALSQETWAGIHCTSWIKMQLSRVFWASLLHHTFRKPVRKVVLTCTGWCVLIQPPLYCSTAPF